MLSGLAFFIVAALSDGRRCLDDRHTNRCDPAQQAASRAMVDARPLEQLARDGDVRRVFYVDGYGHDVGVLTVERPRRGPLHVSFRSPGLTGPRVIREHVHRSMWSGLVAGSETFEQPPPREPPPSGWAGEPEGFTLCMHTWVYTVEAADRGVARSRTANACVDEPARAYARALSTRVLNLFPKCRALRGTYRNDAVRLQACTQLPG